MVWYTCMCMEVCICVCIGMHVCVCPVLHPPPSTPSHVPTLAVCPFARLIEAQPLPAARSAPHGPLRPLEQALLQGALTILAVCKEGTAEGGCMRVVVMSHQGGGGGA